MKRWGAFFCLLFCLTACGKKVRVPQSPQLDAGKSQQGLASWYGEGDGYHGKQTASGERFDKNGLTAAHFDLPFGTVVKVRNLKNNKEVKVKINDRFPVETLRKGRIIDLSFGAARRLDMIRAGVVPVVLTILALPKSAGSEGRE